MKDRLLEVLGLDVKSAAAGRPEGNDGSLTDPSLAGNAAIQIHPPTFEVEPDARIEQSRGIIHEEAIVGFRRANAYFALKNYGRAISDYTRAIEFAPRMPEIYYNRGVAYERTGRFAKAVEDYTKAVEADPQYAKAYGNRASALWSQGERGQALEDMKRAARLGLRELQAYLKSKGIEW